MVKSLSCSEQLPADDHFVCQIEPITCQRRWNARNLSTGEFFSSYPVMIRGWDFANFLLLQIPSSSRKTPPFHVGYQYLKHRKFVTLDMDMEDNWIVEIFVLWILWFWFSIESVHSSWRKDMNVSTFTPSKTSPSLTLGPILASRSSWTDLSTVVIQKTGSGAKGIPCKHRLGNALIFLCAKTLHLCHTQLSGFHWFSTYPYFSISRTCSPRLVQHTFGTHPLNLYQ